MNEQTPYLQILENVECCNIPRDHISWWNLVESSPSLLHNATFGIHINEVVSQLDISFKPSLNDLLMTMHASSSAPILTHAFSTTTKAIGLGNKLSYCILENRSNTSCSCPHFTSHYDNIPRDRIIWGHLVEHSQSLLRAPTLGIHVNEATPYKTIWLTTTLNDLLISKPALFKCQLAHAFNTPTNMTVFGHAPSHVAFVDIDPMPFARAHISHVLIW